MKLAFLVVSILMSLSSRAEESISDIAQLKQWRGLLHFSKTVFSDRSKVKGEKFFISPLGSSSPELELRATIEKMTDSSADVRKEFQCRFPARREFLNSKLPEFAKYIVDCPDLDNWINKIDADKISIIFASGYLNSAPSSFGHTFIKLKSKRNVQKDLLNYGINFSAKTDEQDGVLYAWKGLLGFFPANFSLLQYHLMIKEYVNLEGRDLWEYELNLTPNEIKLILYHTLELEQGYFDYYFVDENCSSMILTILQIARPELDLISEDEFFVIPIDTLKPIQGIVTNTIYRPSLKTVFYQQWNALDDEQKKLIIQYMDGQQQLVEKMKVRTLEALQSWVSLKEAKDPAAWQESSYKLAIARSKITETNDVMTVPIPTEMPTNAHGSSEFSLGLSQTSNKSTATLQWMPAFHEKLAHFDGLPPYSEVKVLNTELYLGNEVTLKNFDLIQVLSNSPVHPLEKPLSWGFSIGDSRYALSNQNQHLRSLGHLGYSLSNSEYCILIALKGGAQQVAEAKMQPLLGPATVVWKNFSSWLRFNAAADFLLFDRDFLLNQQFQLGIDLNKDYWLSLGWQKQSTKDYQAESADLALKFFF